MKVKLILLSLAAFFVLVSCSKNPEQPLMIFDKIAIPPEAKTGAIDGSYEATLDNATNSILTDVKGKTGRVEDKLFFLPGDTDAGKIFEFFETSLAGSEFVKDPDVPLQGRNYQLKHWKSGRQIIAVAVIDAGRDAGGRPIKFLSVILGTKMVL